MIPKEEILEQGRALTYLEKAGWGTIIMNCIKKDALLPEDIIDASCYLIVNKWSPDPFPEWITYIPSLGRKKIIPDFAERIGEKLKLPVYDTIS